MKFPDFSMLRPQDPYKKRFVLGFIFISISFLGMCVILYAFTNSHFNQQEKIQSLKDRFDHVSSEKKIVEMELEQVLAEGDSIKLDKLLAQSRHAYSEEEKNRREGLLWVDQQSATLVATLGALQGLRAGSLLAVYDGNKKIGEVIVDTALDVISYVRPGEKKAMDDFGKNYYRVVIE